MGPGAGRAEGLGDLSNPALRISSPSESTAGETPRTSRSPLSEELQPWFPGLEIVELIGAGGMGAVYKARQPRLNRFVALKILSCPPSHQVDFAMRFEREAQVMARLNHPHIVIIHDFGEVDRSASGEATLFYFLMEFVDGTDLNRLIRAGGLKPEEALRLVPQICDALQFAHDEGITHRDIKPANILVDRKGHVKVTDFGLAKLIQGDDTLAMGLTLTGTAMGTPQYMAPEQWEQPERVDHRADIYSLGVVIYELLTGQRPAGVFDPPSKKCPVDKRIDPVVMRAMEKEPDRRYQQAGQIKEEVTRISGVGRSKDASGAHGATQAKRGPLKLLMTVGAAALLAAGGWMVWQGGDKKDTAAGHPVSELPKTALAPSSAQPDTPTVRAWMNVDWVGQQTLVAGKPGRTLTAEEVAKDGGLRLGKDELWISGQIPDIVRMQNTGIRLRWKRLSDTATAFNVHLRGGSRPMIDLTGSNAIIYHGDVGEEFKLQAVPYGRLAPVGEEMFVEIACVGSLLILKRDGVVQGTRELPEAAPAEFFRFQGSEVIVTHAEVINLDGLSEADALKIAGVDGADHPVAKGASKPGHLRATGTMLNGRPPEVGKLAAIGDFVDVAGGADHWVALRANGETVSSDGKADFTGIRKIARSYQSYHCYIEMAGRLRFHPAREMALPDTLIGKEVVDAACGSHHGVALLDGGQAAVFGRRYEEAMEDANRSEGLGTPRWPQPEAAALQYVKGVAVTYTHAATLHHDGTVSVWGWEGPVEWQPEPRMKPVRQVSSFHDSLHLLDEAGQVWSFPLPRSAHPEQPVGFDGRVRLLGTGAVRLRDHLWLRTDGNWQAMEADGPTVKTLESVTLRPETNFALHASITGPKPFGFVLWIEP
jgi:tRNA A-37 threonylcarbamoyl transferase component Bud32